MPVRTFLPSVLAQTGADRSINVSPRSMPRSHWWAWWLSVFVGLLAALYLVRATAPGLLTYDSLFQLDQALGTEPYNDWHPVVMSLVWEVLINLTGSVGALSAAQILAVWLVANLLGFVLMAGTGRWWGAPIGQLLLVMPHTANMWGAVWKDIQLCIALTASIVIILSIRFVGRKMGWALLFLSLAVLLYGVLVRKNAIVLAPLIVLAGVWSVTGPWTLDKLRAALVKVVAAGVLFVLALVGAGSAIDAYAQPTKNSQFTQVMIDDIIFAFPDTAIERSRAASPELKEKLLSAKVECAKTDAYWDAYWRCYGRGADGEPFTAVAHTDEITALWIEQLPQELPRYVDYRLFTFSKLLFTSKLQLASSDPEGEYAQLYPRAHDALYTYVVDGGLKQAQWLYHGWFWCLVSLVGCVIALKRQSFLALCVFGAGLIYLASFVPTVPAQDYRYVFPLALCSMLGWGAILLERSGRTPEAPTPRSPGSRPVAVE